eukprot:jgi/Tetstr1/452509/TSEL_039545.t1
MTEDMMSPKVPDYFTPPDVADPTKIKAILTTAHDEDAICLGAILWGSGRKEALWLGGYASTDYFLRAEMVHHLLLKYGGEGKLIVYTKGLQEPLNNANRAIKRNGRTLKGKRLIAYDLLKPLADARRERRLVINSPDWVYGGLQAVREVARAGLPEVARLKDHFLDLRDDHPDWHVVTRSWEEEAVA